MSRFGITFDDVAKAAEELIRNGDTPTIDKIRILLGGTGSFTTISKFLNHWRHGISPNQINKKIEAPDFVQSAAARVWQEIHEQAESEIQKIKDDTERVISDALVKTQKIEEEYNRLNQTHNVLSESFKQVSCEKELLLLDLKKIQEDYTLLQERYKSLEERYTEIQELTTRHLKEMSQVHKNEIEKIEQINRNQAIYHEKLLNELKLQHENERHQHIASVDSLKTDIQKKDKNLIELQDAVRNRDIKIAKLETENSSIKSERDFALSRINENDNIWNNFVGKSVVSDDTLSKLYELPKELPKFNSSLLTSLDVKLFDFKNDLKNIFFIDRKDGKNE